MTVPESGESTSWNSEVAAVLFAEFARIQVETGIFAAYLRVAQRFMEDDPESAERVRDVLYTEFPLGVSVEPEFDNESSGRLDVYLIKVNPADGQTIPSSAFYTGYILNPESGDMALNNPDEGESVEPEVSIEQARLLYDQYIVQQEKGLVVR